MNTSRAVRLVLLATAALGLSGCQTLIARWVLPNAEVRPAEHRVDIERGVGFVTGDGVRLSADVYHPRVAGSTPTILVRIPVTKSLLNEIRIDAVGRFWASRGYTAVIQGTRGRFNSGGDYYPLRGERGDGIATLRWLAQQTWFDGRLGMWGGSVFGYTQWVVADQPAPHPSAYMIQIASTDFHGMFYPGGAFSLESALFWAARSHGKEDRDPSFPRLEAGFRGVPLIDADARAIGTVDFFQDWVTHRARDAYWAEIDGNDRARTLGAPVFLMAGWYDPFLPTQLRDYDAVVRNPDARIARGSRLVIGPWTHADTVVLPDGPDPGPYRRASLAPSIPWFDHHLRGLPLDDTLQAPVRLFVMGVNRWRAEQEWPLARTRYANFHLHGDGHANTLAGDGRLDTTPCASGEPSDAFTFDPENPAPSRGGGMLGPRAGIARQEDVEGRDDVLVYTTATLDQDLEITGPVRAVLHVRTTAPSTDFTVKLVDVHPDGRAYNVTDGILRSAFAQPRASSEPTRIEIELWPTSMVFRKGHRMRAEISSSNFPRYDRNPGTGGDIPTETRFVSARQTVLHDARYPSHLVLPVIPAPP